jgi:hypothetical protein
MMVVVPAATGGVINTTIRCFALLIFHLNGGMPNIVVMQ